MKSPFATFRANAPPFDSKSTGHDGHGPSICAQFCVCLLALGRLVTSWTRRKRAKREVQDETVDVMNEMYKKKIATIMERKVDSRANASILERLVALQLARPSQHSAFAPTQLLNMVRFSGPAIFLCMLVSVCCLWAVDLDTEWLYGEHMRHSSMDQEAKNTVELCLTNAWHREEDTFDTFRLEGFDLCETCFIQLYGINQSSWKTEKSSFARASRWEHAATASSRDGDQLLAGWPHTCTLNFFVSLV